GCGCRAWPRQRNAGAPATDCPDHARGQPGGNELVANIAKVRTDKVTAATLIDLTPAGRDQPAVRHDLGLRPPEDFDKDGLGAGERNLGATIARDSVDRVEAKLAAAGETGL